MMKETIIQTTKPRTMYGRYRQWRRSRSSRLRRYSSIISVASDASDAVCLLESNSSSSTDSKEKKEQQQDKPMIGSSNKQKDKMILSLWRSLTSCGLFLRRQQRPSGGEAAEEDAGNHYTTTSTTTSPSSWSDTPEKPDESPSRIKARTVKKKPLYYIISEVGSVSLCNSRKSVQSLSSDEDRNVVNSPRRSLGMCFDRKRKNGSPEDSKQLQVATTTTTTTLATAISTGESISDSTTVTSTSEYMPRRILRSFSFDDPTSIERSSGIIPGDVKLLEAKDDKRDTVQELIQILSEPPLLPFRGRDGINDVWRPRLQERPATLGINAGHPRWIEREKRNVWDEIDSHSSFLEKDVSVPPSSSHVGPLNLTGCHENRSSHSSVNSIATGVDKIFIAGHQESSKNDKLEPSINSREQQPSSPFEWMKKLYHPVLRVAKDIPVCGKLSTVLFEDAPYDEVKHDNARTPLGEISNRKPRTDKERKSVLQPLKPPPKDSPSILRFGLLPGSYRQT